ncbi:uncharacterized protein EV154DRAFT_273846 [Mucor mucedo]|uniref:uncharacterized protein n=1 Tax=Mucor mucedo TaxID=29922 RepID=UPI00221EBEC2|nr:uncharacterized protein EV154DRAFT_273846 [Mucor mucedo]KAI7889557.1 hypothetical protein EV154DRAFT_273846 [Mucor mucedo]
MKPSQIFVKLVNIVALVGYILNVVVLLEGTTSALQKVNGVFHLFLIVFLLTIETQEPAPNVEYLGLYKYWFGRGLFFIWVSMILLNDSVVSVVGSSITGLTGIVFVCIGTLQNCCCGNRHEESTYVALDEPESSTYAVEVPDYQPSLPSYTKRDPRRV